MNMGSPTVIALHSRPPEYEVCTSNFTMLQKPIPKNGTNSAAVTHTFQTLAFE